LLSLSDRILRLVRTSGDPTSSDAYASAISTWNDLNRRYNDQISGLNRVLAELTAWVPSVEGRSESRPEKERKRKRRYPGPRARSRELMTRSSLIAPVRGRRKGDVSGAAIPRDGSLDVDAIELR
jgi:hypothetical protein